MTTAEGQTYNIYRAGDRKVIKAWTRGVPIDEKSIEQLTNTASMPFIYKWIAAMPDVHVGMGATIGSVVATKGAIMPAAVGVDIGCGMMATRTNLTKEDLDAVDLPGLRAAIEKAVPHGKTWGSRDTGAWHNPPSAALDVWTRELLEGYRVIVEKHPEIGRRSEKNKNNVNHLGTLGTGNHFIEVCLDTENNVWIMLHSGSRGVGNLVGSYFTRLAKEDMERYHISLPDRDLAYFPEGTEHFDDYWHALQWAQRFAFWNRALMMIAVKEAISKTVGKEIIDVEGGANQVHCHHNYAAREHHYGENVIVTRKGAVRARAGDLGIIPGSMGAQSFIVSGLGNPESYHSCSHGAGRVHSRTAARKTFGVEDHVRDTEGIECKKDESVLDETPKAYKDIGAVMQAQRDLVEIRHTLRQVICVKG